MSMYIHVFGCIYEVILIVRYRELSMSKKNLGKYEEKLLDS